jgi:hypothetical protein
MLQSDLRCRQLWGETRHAKESIVAGQSNTTIVLAILVAAGIIAAAILFTQGGLLQRSESDPFQGVKAAVAKELLDPASAMFRDVRFDPISAKAHGKVSSSLLSYCGEVNAKNRMGGYVGYKKFYAAEEEPGQWLIVYDEKLVSVMCP